MATTVVLPSATSARAIAFVTRSGAATGRRVCQRNTFTCGIAASALVASPIRRDDRMSGSPPVRIDLPHAGSRADIVERGGKVGRAESALARADPFAAKAEAAIDRASRDQLDQHPVGIAMHQPMNRAHRVVADRVVALGGVADELARVGHELPRDRVGGIAGLNQRGQRRRDGDRIAPGDGLKLRESFRAGEPRIDQGSGGGEALRHSLDGHAFRRVGDGRGWMLAPMGGANPLGPLGALWSAWAAAENGDSDSYGSFTPGRHFPSRMLIRASAPFLQESERNGSASMSNLSWDPVRSDSPRTCRLDRCDEREADTSSAMRFFNRSSSCALADTLSAPRSSAPGGWEGASRST